MADTPVGFVEGADIGTDVLIGVENAVGGAGNDMITGNDLINSLTGAGGDDVLDGRAGGDTMIGGAGNDTYVVDNVGDMVIETAAEGIDVVLSSVGYVLPGNVENLTLLGNAGLVGVGNGLANVISGSDGSDIIAGGAGIDILSGGAGSDLLIGGAGIISVGAAYMPGGAIGTDWDIIGAADVSGDAKADYLWANSGRIAVWTISNGMVTSAGVVNGALGSEWTVGTTGDFNHDGLADLLWTNNGRVAVWELNGSNIVGSGVSNGQIGANFNVGATGDFSGDGNSDLFWVSNAGQVAVWTMQDASVIGGGLSNGSIGTNWSVVGSGDFNGDGRDDILWTNAAGQAASWLMNGQNVQQGGVSGTIGTNWRVGGIGDINTDGKADVVWTNPADNAVVVWHMNGTQVAGSTVVSPGGQIGLDWTLSGVGDVTGDHIDDIVWTRPNGQSVVWDLKVSGDVMTGGAGQDTFQFNALDESFKVVTDFQAGAGGDVLDFHNLLASIGHGGTDALADGTIQLTQNGAATEVQIDADPGQQDFITVVTLQNVFPSQLVHDNFLL